MVKAVSKFCIAVFTGFASIFSNSVGEYSPSIP